MIYNKTLDVKDYEDIKSEEAHINHMKYIFSNTQYSFEHKHRMWEYGMILKALRENATKTLLDVGGGASLFAPACAYDRIDVVQLDKKDRGSWITKQNERLPKAREIEYIKADFLNFSPPQNWAYEFDAVTAISVLEHVEPDLVFFRKLLRFVRPGGLVAVTCDFHPSSKPLVKEHLRTYREADLVPFFTSDGDFTIFREDIDYTWRGPDVNSYTFASIILRRDYE
jgi:2-polyprenyl-3-methyl-5-hydroxy-6-metoxy-1,4-benzoquinol methylase